MYLIFLLSNCIILIFITIIVILFLNFFMSFTRKSTHQEQKKPSIFFRFIKLCIWIIILVLWYLYIWYSNFSSDVLISQKQEIIIKQQENFSDLSQRLSLNETYLKYYITKNHPDYALKVWRFNIPENATIEDILESLQKPIFDTINITTLEGWNIFDTDEYLYNQWLIWEWEYIDYARNNEKIVALTEFFPFIENLTSLEWYLYPDTYAIDPATFAINKFVILQLETFETKVYNKLFWDADISLENFQSVINLASIVEKEEKNSAEKSTVAWILKKRLQEWWMIWADITVCYPYELTANECKLVVTKYLYEKNDYNTRQKTGLPLTPIWSPSYETIEATLNHKVTPYYFYLHDTQTGKIYYAIDNAGHENNKYLYLR